MTKEELLRELISFQVKTKDMYWDQEGAHIRADEALLEYINDEEIKKAYNSIDKWYA